MSTSWQDLIGRGEGQASAASAAATPEARGDEGAPSADPSEYRAYLLRRGAGAPAWMLDLRKVEPKSGLINGLMMSYPHLVAIDYTGSMLITLEFDHRVIVIEGRHLDELVAHLHAGTVTAIQEYSPAKWKARPEEGPIVTKITVLNPAQAVAEA